MDWKIEFIPSIEKQLKKIPKDDLRKIFNFFKERIANNPREFGYALKGKLNEFWRYRVGNYRIIVKINDKSKEVLVVRIAHRKKVYEKEIKIKC